MTAPAHPAWCDRSACEVASGGAHRGEPTRVRLRPNQQPRLLLLLTAEPGKATMIRMVVVGSVIISETTITLDEAHLAANGLLALIAQATPPPPEPESGPIGTRH